MNTKGRNMKNRCRNWTFSVCPVSRLAGNDYPEVGKRFTIERPES